MCQLCTENGKYRTCAACRAELASNVTAFPVSRHNVRLGPLMSLAFRSYRQNWAVLTQAVVLSAALLWTVQAAILAIPLQLGVDVTTSAAAVPGMLLLALCQAFLAAGLLTLGLGAASGEKPALSQLFCGPRLVLRVALQGLAIQAAVWVSLLPAALAWYFVAERDGHDFFTFLAWSFLLGVGSFCVAAFIVASLGYAPLEALSKPALSPRQVLQNALRIAHGKRLTILLSFGISWVCLAMGLAFCLVGLLVALPYVLVLYSSLYLALRNGASGLEEAPEPG